MNVWIKNLVLLTKEFQCLNRLRSDMACCSSWLAPLWRFQAPWHTLRFRRWKWQDLEYERRQLNLHRQWLSWLQKISQPLVSPTFRIFYFRCQRWERPPSAEPILTLALRVRVYQQLISGIWGHHAPWYWSTADEWFRACLAPVLWTSIPFLQNL